MTARPAKTDRAARYPWPLPMHAHAAGPRGRTPDQRASPPVSLRTIHHTRKIPWSTLPAGPANPEASATSKGSGLFPATPVAPNIHVTVLGGRMGGAGGRRATLLPKRVPSFPPHGNKPSRLPGIPASRGRPGVRLRTIRGRTVWGLVHECLACTEVYGTPCPLGSVFFKRCCTVQTVLLSSIDNTVALSIHF